MFDPKLEIGQIITNKNLCEIFHCANSGGMRRSMKLNTLVLIADYTKGLYHDKWIGGVLHYTGMGRFNDQDLNSLQNKTLSEMKENHIDVHLFEVINSNEYIYCGRVKLVGEPYTESQPDANGNNRNVWMFPIRPVPDNNVIKPEMYVFKDEEDYRKRGKNVDEEYNKTRKKKKKIIKESNWQRPIEPEKIAPSTDLIGVNIEHKVFGRGKIVNIQDAKIIVLFEKCGEKKLEYETSIKNDYIKIRS